MKWPIPNPLPTKPKTPTEWVDNYASETLHSWGLKGYPNLLDELKEALMFAVKEAPRMSEQPTTPKPRCDAQGRLLEAPNSVFYYCDMSGQIEQYGWADDPCDRGALAHGRCFISQPAAEAELTRLKCLQRLRGMEGFTLKGGWEACVGPLVILSGYETAALCYAAEATITPEERAAFLYREPNHA
jgi:hypothetical protein